MSSCSIMGVNENGQPSKNSRLTAVVNAVDSAIFGNVNDAYKNLGYVPSVTTNNVTKDVIQKSLVEASIASINNFNQIIVPANQYAPQSLEALEQLNLIFRDNYGINVPVFTVKQSSRYAPGRAPMDNPNIGFAKVGGQTVIVNSSNLYEVNVNTDVLNQLNNGLFQTAEAFANQINTAYDEGVRIQNEELDQLRRELEESEDGEVDDSLITFSPGVKIDSVKDQIVSLQKAFLAAGVTVRVEIDPELTSKGRVVTNPDGTTVVKLNPNNLSEDTHIHEFSHILVDLLGVDHPTVREAIAQLKGTTLEAKVKEKYPHLSGEKLDKEIVVTAIGLAGAKINRNKPNLFQRIFNKIARALRSVFKINEDAVEKLANQLLVGRLDRSEFKGSLSYYEQNSVDLSGQQKKFEDTVQQVRIAVEDALLKAERTSEDQRNEQEINTLKVLKKKLENVEKVENLIDFVNYASRLATKAEDIFENIATEFKEGSTSPEDRMNLIHKLYNVSTYLNNFFNGDNSLMEQIEILITKDIRKINRSISTDPKVIAENAKRKAELDVISATLADAVGRMKSVKADYYDAGIPMMVDLLLEYNSPEINNNIQILIDNNSKFGRTVGLQKDEEYKNLTAQYKEALAANKDNKDATDDIEKKYKEALTNLANAQLANRKIGRETLINELREITKDKSAFSYWLDPFVYSSQPALQLFATFVKDSLYKASDDTRELIYRLAPAYRKYEQIKGTDLNPTKFNEDILEVHGYSLRQEDGSYKNMRMLSFVQPFDVNKYNLEQAKMKKEAKEKFKKPGKDATDAEREAWKKSKERKQYYAFISKWEADNTVPSPDADARKALIEKKLSIANASLKRATLNNNPDAIAIASADIITYKAALENIWDEFNKSYRGTAVMPNSRYANPKYEALKKNAPAFEYYNALLEEYKRSQKMINYQGMTMNSWDTFSYIVPSIRSTGLDKIQKDGAFSAAKDFGKDTFTFLETDTAYGDAINANEEFRNKTVPIFFTGALDEQFVTRDIGTSVVQFAAMANMYNRKSQIQGAVILMSDIIEKQVVTEVAANNVPIINKLAKRLGFTRYKRKTSESNNHKHLKAFIEMNFFGEKEIKEEFDFAGKQFSLNKISAQLASYTAMANLSFNALQAVNQGVIDNIRLREEAIAGEFFSSKDYFWAKKEYLGGQALKSIGDMGAFAPTSKIVQAAQIFDAFGNYQGAQMEKKTGARGLKAVSLDGMFVLQHGFEHESAMTRMLAMFKSYEGKLLDSKGEVLKTAEGKPVNIYDIIIDGGNGVYKLRDDIYIHGEIKDGKPELVRFNKIQVMNKISSLTKKTNQIKNETDKVVLQRHWMGRLVMLFRNYFVPSLRRHYGHASNFGIHTDLESGMLSEGTLVTLGRFIKESFENKGVVATWNQLSPMEKANMKRLRGTGFYFLAASLIISSLTAAMEDDDEEKTYANMFLMYQALRVQSELTQFIKINEFIKLAQSPTAAVRPLENISKLLSQIPDELNYIFRGDREGVFYENRTGIHQKGDRKFLAYLERMSPILQGVEKSRTPDEASKWFNLD